MAAFLRTFLADPAIRYGIKFGLAGMLAVLVALIGKLEMPTWALFTVFVLMIAQYVGAIAEKSIFRLIGTCAGALLGYLVTALFEQQPVIFLTLTGVIVGICTAMFGQSRYPYAFLLCGMTMTVVTSNGMADPDNSWQYALLRIEEVCVGIVCVLLVQSLLWPRYARVEFTRSACAAFGDLRECFAASAKALFCGGGAEAARRAEEFPARITALRGLLDFGARESQYFRNRLSTYFEITNCLARIASAIATLSRTLPENSYYREKVRGECEAVTTALEHALDDLSRVESTAATRAAHRTAMDAAFEALGKHLIELRTDPRLFHLANDEVLAFGLHMLAFDEIRGHIKRAHELLDSLPVEMGDFSYKEPEPFVSPIPPPFWIRNGCKAGLAVVLALVLDNWLNVPGGAMFVLGAWVFTSLNATSPGGRGDRRAFHYVIAIVAVLIAMSLLLLLIRPMLSSYAVMNTIIFTWLFCWGYLSFSTHGVTVPMQLAMLIMVGILGLNGQEPVTFQAIVQFFFGISFAAVLAAVVQRVLWPSLPQWEIRDRFIEFLQTCQRIIEKGPQNLPLWQRTRIALIPGETDLRIARLGPPICPPGENERLTDYLMILRRVGAHLIVAVGHLAPLLPPEHAAEGQKRITALEAELQKHLRAHEDALLASEKPDVDPGELAGMITAWTQWIVDLRTWMLHKQMPAQDVIRIIGLSGRYEEAGRDLILAGEQAGKLRLSLYMGDYEL